MLFSALELTILTRTLVTVAGKHRAAPLPGPEGVHAPLDEHSCAVGTLLACQEIMP